MKRKLLGLFLAMVMATMAAIVATTPASASFTVHENCSWSGTGKCSNSAYWDTIIAYTNDPANSNEWVAAKRDYLRCGNGYVTATCPFDNTSFDRQHLGAPIDWIITYKYPVACYYWYSDSYVYQIGIAANGDCVNTGVDWVRDGYSWINPYGTNQTGSQQFMRSDGVNGDQIFTAGWVSGYAQWGWNTYTVT